MTNCVASELCLVIHQCKTCGAESIVLRKSLEMSDFLSGVLCHIFAQTTNAFAAPCALVIKDRVFLACMWHKQLVKATICHRLLEATDFMLQVIFCGYMPLWSLSGKVNCFAQSGYKYSSLSGVLCRIHAQTTNAFDAQCAFVKKDRVFWACRWYK